MLLSKLSVSIILSEIRLRISNFSEIDMFYKILILITLSNSLQKRTRMSIILHSKSVFHTYFGVNLIIGGVLLTLAILTLQHQPTGRWNLLWKLTKIGIFIRSFFLLNILLNVYFAPTLRFNLVIYILKVSSRYHEQKKGALHHIFLKKKI